MNITINKNEFLDALNIASWTKIMTHDYSTQSELFPGGVGWSKPHVDKDRKRVIKEVYDKADPDFITRYTSCVLEFDGTFIAQDVTESYELRFHKLDLHQKKAIGQIYIKLQRDGLIRKTGAYRTRNQGNITSEYVRV